MSIAVAMMSKLVAKNRSAPGAGMAHAMAMLQPYIFGQAYAQRNKKHYKRKT